MNVQEIFTLARSITATDTSSFPDTDLIKSLNVEYAWIRGVISSRMTNFVDYQEWYNDLTSGQSVYPLPTRTSTDAWCSRVISVSVKVGDKFYAIPEQSQSNLSWDLNSYADSKEWFYLLRGNSINLYPTPTETVVGGLYLYGEANAVELSVSSVETDIKIPVNYQSILVHGLASWIFMQRRLPNDALSQMQIRDKIKENMIAEYSPMNKEPLEMQVPNLSNLS